MPASSQVSLVGGEMSVRNRVLAFACAPPGRPGVGTHARLLSTSRSSLNGASGASVGVSSKAAPSAAGVHCSMTMPFGTYITPNRVIGFAAVFWSAVNDGTMASSSGSASVAPMPRRTVRRGIAFLVISMALLLRRSRCGSRAVLRPVRRAHGKRCARSDANNDRRPAIAVTRSVARDAPHRGLVARVQASSERVGQQLLRERTREVFLMAGDEPSQSGDAFEACAVWKRARGINGDAVACRAPLAKRVEVLEREPQRIHAHVADRARWILPVRLHLLTDRHRLRVRVALVQQRDIRRRRWRWRAENIVEQPSSAQNRRGPIWIRGHGQDAALAEEPAADAVGERDAPKVAAIYVRNLVVTGEPLVHERIVRRQEIDDAAVLAQLRADEQPRFLVEGVAQLLVQLRLRIDVRHDAGELADGEPLSREVIDERLSSSIREHPPYLPFQRCTIAQRAFRRDGEQFFVRDAAPEKERQPGCEIEIA